jgi:hypothetical protein
MKKNSLGQGYPGIVPLGTAAGLSQIYRIVAVSERGHI